MIDLIRSRIVPSISLDFSHCNFPIRGVLYWEFTTTKMITKVAIQVLQIAGLIIFSIGFFQWTPSTVQFYKDGEWSPISIALKDRINSLSVEDAPFDRMIFMVIDALRQDFVFGERFKGGFNWLSQHLETNGKSVVAVARAPTVTMPRLRALTAGTAPRFLDLLFNVMDGDAPSDDSWVAQSRKLNKGTLHYGDDTWMRLFGTMLHSDSEGTHSFYVTDTVEVDRNVTRHLPDAMKRDDWQILTLHYLGLDHIGHVGGVSSPLLIPKLQEMDGIIERLYDGLKRKDEMDGKKTLLIVLGDHGMTESGNHGGSSREEKETACIFLAPLYSEKVPLTEVNRPVIDQVDIAPTISLLLGLSIPRGSTGCLVEDFIPKNVSDENVLWMWNQNAVQLARLLGPTSMTADMKSHLEEALECHISKSSSTCSKLYQDFCRQASEMLAGDVGEYDMTRLLTGITAAILSVVILLTSNDRLFLTVTSTCCVIIFSLIEYYRGHQGITFTFIIFAIIYASFKIRVPLPVDISFLMTVVGYAVIMFSSTFIEEEHEYWHFIFTSMIIYESLQRQDIMQNLGILGMFRSLKYWNSTGFLYQSDPDVRLFLISHPEWQLALYLTCLLGLLLTWSKLERCLIRRLLYSVGCLLAAFHKFESPWTEGVSFQRVCLFVSAVNILMALIKRSAPEIVLTVALFYTLVLKAHNALPVLVLTLLTLNFLPSHRSLATRIALVHASYFLLGPCHLVASVDFSPAYIGQHIFRPVITGLMGFLVTWAGPIITIPVLKGKTETLLGWRGIVHGAVLTCLALLRHHISVWTVFAPRLLFEYGWTLFYTIFLIIDLFVRK